MELNKAQIQHFNEKGWLHIPSFYDFKTEVFPILRGIWDISLSVAKRHSVKLNTPEFSEDTFDVPYYMLKDLNRKYASEVYDLIKQIPAFVRLIGCEKNVSLYEQLRPNSAVGVGKGSFGIRIDNPDEKEFATYWHQDYLSHFGSPDGLVLWSGLAPVTEDMGPLLLLSGSHKDGIQPLCVRTKNYTSKTASYQENANNYAIKNEKNLVEKFKSEFLETGWGDIVILDYLTVHKSGANVSKRARWTMQHRLFNFNNEEGQKIGWHGGFATGVNPNDVYPEYFTDEEL